MTTTLPTAAPALDPAPDDQPEAPAPVPAPPPPPSPRDETDYNALASEALGRLAIRNAGSNIAAFRKAGFSPDDEARARALSAQTGVPVEAVRVDPGAFWDALNDRQQQSLLQQRPKTALFLSDPTRAVIAHDDLESLGAVEGAVNGLRGFGQGIIGQSLGAWMSGAYEEKAMSERAFNRGVFRPTQQALGFEGLTDEQLTSVQESGSRPLKTLGEGLKTVGEAIGPDPNSTAGAIGAGLGQLTAQVGVALATGGVGSMILSSFQGADQMADKAREHGVYGTAAGDVGILGGALLTPALEKIGLDRILYRLPPKVKNKAVGYALDKIAAAGWEGTSEAAEQVGQNALAKYLYAPNQDLGEGVWESGKVGGIVGGIARVLFAGLPGRASITAGGQDQTAEAHSAVAAGEVFRDDLRAHQAEDGAAKIEAVVDAIRQTKTHGRDPQAMAEFVQGLDLAEGGASISTEHLFELHQDGALSEDDARAVGIDLDALSTLGGGDIPVNAALLFTRMASLDPQKARAIAQRIRLSPEAMTAAEATQAEAQATAKANRSAAEVIRDEVAQSIRHANPTAYSATAAKANGELMAARVLRRAADRNMDPLALWAEERPTIVGEMSTGGAEATKSENAGEMSTGQELRQKVQNVLDTALQDNSSQLKERIHDVQPWLREALKDRLGLDLDGYAFSMDAYAVRHILKRHGDAKKEEQQGQLAITPQDIAMFPDVVQNPDRIIANIKNNRGQEIVGFIKVLEDGSTLVVSEVRTGRKEFALTSARKYPPRANATAIDASLALNARNDGGNDLIVIDVKEHFKQTARGTYTPATIPFELEQSTTPRGTAWGSLAGDVASFTADVKRVLQNGARRRASVRVGETPLIFNRLGITRRELRMFESKIEKIIKHDHPAVGPDQLGRAAALLADPVIVMKSATESGAMVAVLDDIDANGDFLIAAIHPSDGTVQFDKLASVYGKERINPQGSAAEDWIASNVSRGAVLFFNTKKAPKLSERARVYIPAVQKVRGQNPTLLTERDLVKARRGYPHLYQGQTSRRGTYTPATDTIRLFKQADLSTFAHEAGHRWLFELVDDLGDARLIPAARERTRDAVAATLDYLGVTGVDLATATPEQVKEALSVEQHEKWARSVEAYLREGRAPDPSLRRAFRQFAKWLGRLYRSISGLNVELTPEIRTIGLKIPSMFQESIIPSAFRYSKITRAINSIISQQTLKKETARRLPATKTRATSRPKRRETPLMNRG